MVNEDKDQRKYSANEDLLQFLDMFYELQRTAVDWEYTAAKSRRHSIASINGASWPRGLTLGGSGSIGTMRYERGNRRDYQRWEQLGNTGWGWDSVLRYFKKSEDNRITSSTSGRWHGRRGYLNVDYLSVEDPMNDILKSAAREMGYNELNDYNGEENVGYGRAQFMVVNGTRCSPAKAFLNPVVKRRNLHIIKHAYVTSVLFSSENVAQGVNFVLRNRYSMKVNATKEVIISTGVVNTPKLLMLSGIGRQEDLSPFRIIQRADLAVGYNLQDHVGVPLFYKFNKSNQVIINLTLEKVLNLFEFVFKGRRKSLSNHDLASFSHFINTRNASDAYPDVRVDYQLFKKGGITSYLVMQNMGYDFQTVESVHQAELDADVLMVRISVLNPKSRGTIKLSDGDPYVDPTINAEYFDDYEDARSLIRAIRIHQQMLMTDSFRENEAQLHRVPIPACLFIHYDSDEYWECYIRHLSVSLYHPAGTAKMGPDSDPNAVVDSRLKVRQVGGLRVVDASVMPNVVSGGLMAPTIMIGEKGSDMIKEDYAYKNIIGLQTGMIRTRVDWQYSTEQANDSSLSIVNGTYWPSGKMLGGSSSINRMQYVRGNQDDYDEWQRLGNSGWGWSDVLPYFIKSEDNKDSGVVSSYGGKYHGVGGFLSVETAQSMNIYNEIVRQAIKEAGYKQLPDLNGEEHIGYGTAQITAEGATRASTAKAFLNTIQSRKNLHIIKNAFVVSLHYGSENTVRGVNMIIDDQYSLRALASKEVILSAGAINTPKLLMLSGIGRKEDLQPFNIPVRAELNVGGNLQDHVFVPIFYGIGKPITNIEQIRRDSMIDLVEFTLRNRSTFISQSIEDSLMGFVNTKDNNAKFPDAQILNFLIPKGDTNAVNFFTVMDYNRNVLNSIEQHVREQDVAVVRVVCIDPKSRGRIRIKSANPYHHPSIDTGYFSHADDLEVIRKGIRMQQNVLRTKTFQNLEAKPLRIGIPECDTLEYDSDDYWECYVRHMSTTLYHYSGTAKMGPWSDPEAVVDSELKVFGVRGLRVVDGSIMPTVTSGNTNAPIIMIAEKASDIIKNSYS